MSRNGTGTYTLPAGNPVVTGTTISSTWANNTLSDIATALTQSLAKDGQTTPTANIPLGGFKITGLGAPTTAGDALAYGSSLGAVTATTGTFSGNVQMASANGGQLAGLRNRIINGACQVAQRGNIAAVLGNWTYGGADRILVLPFAFTTATGTIAQISGYGSLGFAQSVALTTTGSGSVNFESRLEYRNVIGLNSNTVTFSVKVYQDTGSSVSTTISIFKATAQDNFTGKTNLGTSSSVSVVSSTTTVLTYTLALGSTDASNGLSVQINFNSVGAVTSKTFLVTDLQLEVGPVATPFEQRPYGMELALCQRYLPRCSNGAGFAYALNAGQFMFPFEVSPRVSATGVTVLTHGLMNCTGTARTADGATFVRGDGNSGVLNIVNSTLNFTATVGQGATLLSGDYLFTGCEL
jgi:hypothetical protein